MNLSPREKDKLLVSVAAMVARGRLERGVKLNHPEAIALITDFVVEGARDGKPVSELMETGAGVVRADQCMDGIAEMIHEVQVEATEQGDHYDPQQLAVRLTPDKLEGRTLTAITVAAHEVGHALQHAAHEPLFMWRSRLAQSAVVAQRLGSLLILLAQAHERRGEPEQAAPQGA